MHLGSQTKRHSATCERTCACMRAVRTSPLAKSPTSSVSDAPLKMEVSIEENARAAITYAERRTWECGFCAELGGLANSTSGRGHAFARTPSQLAILPRAWCKAERHRGCALRAKARVPRRRTARVKVRQFAIALLPKKPFRRGRGASHVASSIHMARRIQMKDASQANMLWSQFLLSSDARTVIDEIIEQSIR
eukprot:4288819-Pleurochrysis_carterae.AAC.2